MDEIRMFLLERFTANRFFFPFRLKINYSNVMEMKSALQVWEVSYFLGDLYTLVMLI